MDNPAVMMMLGQNWKHGVDHETGSLVKGRKRKLSVRAVFAALAMPCVLFCCAVYVTAFWLRFYHPFVCLGILAITVLATSILCAKGLNSGINHETPSWFGFFSTSMGCALICGLLVGQALYQHCMKVTYSTESLLAFQNVYPNRVGTGAEVPPFGSIDFATGTRVDMSKSMGFAGDGVFCVAPLVVAGEPMPSYEFWAVGKDCCTDASNDFHCEGFDEVQNVAGFHLMNNTAESYYLKAVQRAMQAYGFAVVHPVFVENKDYALSALKARKLDGIIVFSFAVCLHFFVQASCIGCKLLRLKKTGDI
jgi:hypothetical protein